MITFGLSVFEVVRLFKTSRLEQLGERTNQTIHSCGTARHHIERGRSGLRIGFLCWFYWCAMIYVYPIVHFSFVAHHVNDCKWEFSFIYFTHNELGYPQLFKKKRIESKTFRGKVRRQRSLRSIKDYGFLFSPLATKLTKLKFWSFVWETFQSNTEEMDIYISTWNMDPAFCTGAL